MTDISKSNSTAQDASAKRYNPLGQLVTARVREFVREPAAIFWVYVFPILMMCSLGIAFRDQPVVDGHHRDGRRDAVPDGRDRRVRLTRPGRVRESR